MLKRSLMSLVLIGAGAIGFSALPAAAVTLPVPVMQYAPSVHESGLYQEAAARVTRNGRMVRDLQRRDVRRTWNRRFDGPRCLARYGNCRHFYRGYYYSSPWWTFPLVGGSLILGNGYYGGGYYGHSRSAHVRWCSNHYRSYNVRTNTWISNSGVVHRCRSPYI